MKEIGWNQSIGNHGNIDAAFADGHCRDSGKKESQKRKIDLFELLVQGVLLRSNRV